MMSATKREIVQATDRMVAYAEAHGEIDTQGIMDDEWYELARAALGDRAERDALRIRLGSAVGLLRHMLAVCWDPGDNSDLVELIRQARAFLSDGAP